MSKKNSSSTFLTSRLLFSIFVASIIVLLGELTVRSDRNHEQRMMRDALYSTATVLTQQIQQNVASGIFATDTLYSMLNLADYDVDQFERWSKSILTVNPNVSALQLAPEGVVSHIYPNAEHQQALGHNLLKDHRRNDGALKAIESRELTFIGPIKLIQNGKYAVIARRPVFHNTDRNESFWGFAIALIYVDTIIPAELYNLEEKGIKFSLSGYNPDVSVAPIFEMSEQFSGSGDISLPIKVPNGIWMLRLSLPEIDNKLYFPARIFFIIIALSIGSLIFIQQIRMRHKTLMILELNQELKDLSFCDDLTGLANRRSANYTLTYLIHQARRFKEPLCVGMIDLDHFKQINDQYGHPVGDAVLKHCSTVLDSVIRESDTLARLGGDEFVCFFPRTDMNAALSTVEKMALSLKKKPFVWQGKTISVSLSIGISLWDSDSSQEQLLNCADIQLYRAKQEGRDRICS